MMMMMMMIFYGFTFFSRSLTVFGFQFCTPCIHTYCFRCYHVYRE